MERCCEELPIELGRNEPVQTMVEYEQEGQLSKRIRELSFRKPTPNESWAAYQCTKCGQYWWSYLEDIRWGPDEIYHKVTRDELHQKFPNLKLE